MSEVRIGQGWSPAHRWREPALACAILIGGSLRLIMKALNPTPAPLPTSMAYLAALLMGTAAVVLRSRMPTLSLTIATISSVFMTATGLNWIGSLLPTLVCVYATSLRFPRRATLIRVIPSIASVAASSAIVSWTQNHSPEVIPTLLALIAAAAFGRSARGRRQYLEATLERAQAIAQNAQQQERRKLAEQRLAIAHELHDVVAHHMTIINVQAGVAVAAAPHDAERAATAAKHCQTAAQEALAELHTMLGVLRSDPPPAEAQRPEKWQKLSSATDQSLIRLIEDQRSLGTDVAVSNIDLVSECAALVRHVVYRVVQEALTNARKHSPGAHCRLTVTREADRLRIEIANGPQTLTQVAPVASSQTGLAGIKTRVTEIGGDVSWGRTPDSGFRVVVTVPTQIVQEQT